MGRPDLVTKWKDTFDRLQESHARELYEVTAKWVAASQSADLIELAKKHAFPVAEVEEDYEITNEEWRRERGSVMVYQDDMYGKLVMPGPSALLSKTPGRTRWLARPLGYHNRFILKKLLGYSDEEIKLLEKERVVGYWDDRPGIKPPVYYDMEKDPVFSYSGE
jgi:crotonobetainyl-CoA:carnitine CoA-transferase CaiB-like acyl-CoA transferase